MDVIEVMDKCPDCAVAPGEKHLQDCDIERCSVCGKQFVSCRCLAHDKNFARWVGFFPGEIECYALGYVTDANMPDLNKLYSTGLYRIFFCKPV